MRGGGDPLGVTPTTARLRVVVEEAAGEPLAQVGVLLRVQDERVQTEVHVVRRDHGDDRGRGGDHEGHRLVCDPLRPVGGLPVVDDHEVREALEQLLTGHHAPGLLVGRTSLVPSPDSGRDRNAEREVTSCDGSWRLDV